MYLKYPVENNGQTHTKLERNVIKVILTVWIKFRKNKIWFVDTRKTIINMTIDFSSRVGQYQCTIGSVDTTLYNIVHCYDGMY